MNHLLYIPVSEMWGPVLAGAVLGLIYLYLLWQTIQILPRVKHRGAFLFASAVLRLFLLIFAALLVAGDHAGKFLLTILAALVMRRIVLSFVKKDTVNQAEFAQKSTKNKLNKKMKNKKLSSNKKGKNSV